jgi:hypothetical protein
VDSNSDNSKTIEIKLFCKASSDPEEDDVADIGEESGRAEKTAVNPLFQVNFSLILVKYYISLQPLHIGRAVCIF